MSRAGFLSVLVLAGCASGGGITSKVIPIGPDTPISIEVPRVQAGASGVGMQGQVEIGVEVINHEDADITVEKVLVRPAGGTSAFAMDVIQWSGHELVEAHDSLVIHVKGTGQQLRMLGPRESGLIILWVQVTLGNGDTYYGEFEVPVLGRT